MFKKLLCVFLTINLAFMGGCTGLIVSHDKNPKQIQESQAIFISKIPAGEYPKIKLTRNYKVADMEDRIRKEGNLKDWAIFINTERIVLRNYGGKGAERRIYGPGYLEPGYMIAAKHVLTDKNGKLYEVKFLGRCGNDVPAGEMFVLVSPDVWKYTDVDYTPALWTGLAALIAGIIAGHLLWPINNTSTVVISAARCLTGAPAGS
jgi:hypothetical protein